MGNSTHLGLSILCQHLQRYTPILNFEIKSSISQLSRPTVKHMSYVAIGSCKYIQPTLYIVCSLPMNRPLTRRDNLKIFYRNKYTEKLPDDVESDDEENWENDPLDKGSRVMKVRVNSLRTDLILKAGLGIARNKVETIFYESKIRVNGEKILKKSTQLRAGDEVDIIRGQSPANPDFLTVSRVHILAARQEQEGKITVHLRTNKSLLVENYAEPWKGT